MVEMQFNGVLKSWLTEASILFL